MIRVSFNLRNDKRKFFQAFHEDMYVREVLNKDRIFMNQLIEAMPETKIFINDLLCSVEETFKKWYPGKS